MAVGRILMNDEWFEVIGFHDNNRYGALVYDHHGRMGTPSSDKWVSHKFRELADADGNRGNYFWLPNWKEFKLEPVGKASEVVEAKSPRRTGGGFEFL